MGSKPTTTYAPIETQLVHVELLRRSVHDGYVREMQLYLALRAITHGRSGRFFADSGGGLLAETLGWSRQTIARAMARAEELELIERRGEGYVVRSITKLLARDCIRGRAVVVVPTDVLRRKSNGFKPFVAAAVMCKDIEYRNRFPMLRKGHPSRFSGSQQQNGSVTGRSARGVEADGWCSCRAARICARCVDAKAGGRGRRRVKGLRYEVDGERAREGIYALTLLARGLGCSIAAATRIRRAAAAEGFIRLESRIDTETFGLVPVEQVALVIKAYPETANSWTRVRRGGVLYGALRAPSAVTGRLDIRRYARRYSRAATESAQGRLPWRCAVPSRAVLDRFGLSLVEEAGTGRGWVISGDGRWQELPGYTLPGFDGHETALPTWRRRFREAGWGSVGDVPAEVALPLGREARGESQRTVYIPRDERGRIARLVSEGGWTLRRNSVLEAFQDFFSLWPGLAMVDSALETLAGPAKPGTPNPTITLNTPRF